MFAENQRRLAGLGEAGRLQAVRVRVPEAVKDAVGHGREPERASGRLIYGAFLISGFAGLMHEVVWAKLLAGFIGATAYSQTVVLAVFMGGLAIGSALFGRGVDSTGRPLRTYVWLEVTIAAYCLLIPALLGLAGSVYVALASRWFESTALIMALRIGFATIVVLPPATLMGGTLPILARHFVQRLDETQSRVARLYALNSFGAVLGAGCAGFLTLPILGLYESLVTASLLSLVAALMVIPSARRERAAATCGEFASSGESPGLGDTSRAQPRFGVYVVTLVALALSGFAALGYEVLFTRVIALAFGSSTYSFTVMLMCFTAGIGVGSAVVSRMERQDPLWLLGLCQLSAVISLILVTPLLARLPYLIGLLRLEVRDLSWGFELYQLAKAALVLLVLLVPTACLGASFPLVARVRTDRVDLLGTEVGFTYACNTIGNVLGVVATALFLLPALGLVGALHFNLGLNLLAGAVFLSCAHQLARLERVGAVLIALVVVGAYWSSPNGWSDPLNYSVDHLYMTRQRPSSSPALRALHPAHSFERWNRTFVTNRETVRDFFFAEDPHATVLAYNDGVQAVLAVNGKTDASTQGDLSTQVLLAHLPLLANLQARTLLVVGYGSGITLGSALLHPLERADLVEISTAVLDADRLFAEYNYRALEDPRVHVYKDDGQSFLRAVPRRFDVIISEPTNPWIAGVAGLFTVEYFRSMRDRLNPGGVAAIWFHQYDQSDESVALVLRTLRSVFPQVEVFGLPDAADLIAVASVERWVPAIKEIESRIERPAIRKDFERIGISSLTDLLSMHVVSAGGWAGLVPSGPLNTVRHQRLEYTAPRTMFRRETSTFLEQAIARRAANALPLRRNHSEHRPDE